MSQSGSNSLLKKRKKNDSSDNKSRSSSSDLITQCDKSEKQQNRCLAKVNTSLKSNNNKNMNSYDSKLSYKQTSNSTSDKGVIKATEDDEKQMVSACCVCSDDTGYSDNLLVYCDGKGCQVAVHQGCYGIINIPEGPWFCRMCEYKQSSRVTNNNIELNAPIITKCELCPLREGAVKRTDNGKWAHVVCALYIPEVTFGNVRTMEPIILKEIRVDRYNKRCSLCEANDSSENESNSNLSTNESNTNDSNRENLNNGNGVYVNCNKSGCKHWFHVTW
jgi:hypothetical protein